MKICPFCSNKMQLIKFDSPFTYKDIALLGEGYESRIFNAPARSFRFSYIVKEKKMFKKNLVNTHKWIDFDVEKYVCQECGYFAEFVPKEYLSIIMNNLDTNCYMYEAELFSK